MGKASRRKGLVKAKPRRSNRGFLVAVVVVFVLGVALIALARNDDGRSAAAKGPGAKQGDHWHAAIGINLSGTWQANLPQYEPSPNTGIHSHGDGFMHLHPFSAAGAGRNANVGLFYRQAGDKTSAPPIKHANHTHTHGDVSDNLDQNPGLGRLSVHR